MEYTLTVVVPVYNVEKYLEKCVQSIENQFLMPTEVILVDDGSTDNSGVIAEELKQRWNNIRVIHQKNGGLSAARNSGIDAAKCEYITFVDSDDYIDPEMYSVLMEQMIAENADISIGGVWYEQETGEKYAPYPEQVYRVWQKEEALIELNSYRYFNMSFCDAIFKLSLFNGQGYKESKLRFPLRKLSEDQYLMHKIVARADHIVYTSRAFYHYVQRKNSISRNTNVNTGPMGASLAQLEFFNRWFPHLNYVAEPSVAFSHILIYNSYVRQGLECPKELRSKLRCVVKKYLRSVLRNSHIPKVKKIQALTFCYCLPGYRLIVCNRAHR